MEQTAERMRFDFLPGRPIVVEPRPTRMSSDAGIRPLRQFDDPIGFTERFVAGLHDPRHPALIDHGFDERVRQRIYGILAGYAEGDQGGSLVVTAISSWSSFTASTSDITTCPC